MTVEVLTPAESMARMSRAIAEFVPELVLGTGDTLIVCAGFEDRATASLKAACQHATDFRVVMIEYRPKVAENKTSAIAGLCRAHGVEFESIIYDREHPAGFGDRLLDIVSPSSWLFIDVSAMSRLLIVQIVVALGCRKDGFGKSTILYAEAESYPPSRDEAELELARCAADPTSFVVFLTSGLFDITVVPELSSVGPAGGRTRLVAFPSLDASHLLALRAEAQASKYSFIEGVPPSRNNSWRTALIGALNHLDEFPDAERFLISTLDYRETLDCLLGIYAQHGLRERIIISPTGSKMQTVAVGLFRSFVKDTQIVYPTPQSFRHPGGYTIGVGPLRRLSLHGFSAQTVAEDEHRSDKS